VKIEKKLPNCPKNTFNNHVVLGALYCSDSENTSKTIHLVCKNIYCIADHHKNTAWNRSVKKQKVRLRLPYDAKLWVRLPFDSGIATVKGGAHEVLHALVAKYPTL